MGVRATVTMSGLGFAAAGDDALVRLARGETLAAERLGVLALDRVPFDQGTLAGSQAVIPATDPTEGAAVTFDTPYAARLHEHPEYNFSTDSNPNAQGKYLEGAALDNRRELGEIIRQEVRRG